jgi:hypothetical protein
MAAGVVVGIAIGVKERGRKGVEDCHLPQRPAGGQQEAEEQIHRGGEISKELEDVGKVIAAFAVGALG